MASEEKKKKLPPVTLDYRSRQDSMDSMDSYTSSNRTARPARFAEATSVLSPVEPSEASKNAFLNCHESEPKPADVGFGYLSPKDPSRKCSFPGQSQVTDADRRFAPPHAPMSPLKSALKSPGTPRRFDNPLSPAFREEDVLEKRELETEKEQAKDLKVKYRVRIAKLFLRGIDFSCSLIVVSMVAASFAIFNATRNIPPRNNLPPWAKDTPMWPQIVILSVASFSLLTAICVFWAYWRGGHRRAEKVAVYYTTFAVAFFVFSIIMWVVAAAVLNQSKEQGKGQDMWGWSCKDNKRRELFKDDVAYDLVCRLQDWALICCIIEIVVETLVISLYAIVFYRYWSKRKLRKSMAIRDKARSDLYLAQLRSQSVPNTPGFGPLSPRDGGWRPPPGHSFHQDPLSAAENGALTPTTVQFPRGVAAHKPFTLQPPPPPIRVQAATPKMDQGGFASPARTPSPPSSAQGLPSPNLTLAPMSPGYFMPVAVPTETVAEHVPPAAGETRYEAVPIPKAYGSPVASPSFASARMTLPGEASWAMVGPQAQPAVPLNGVDFGESVKSQR